MSDSVAENLELLNYSEMKNVVELLDLYIQVNNEVLGDPTLPTKSVLFARITDKMMEMRAVLLTLPLDTFQVSKKKLLSSLPFAKSYFGSDESISPNSRGSNLQSDEVSVWDYFAFHQNLQEFNVEMKAKDASFKEQSAPDFMNKLPILAIHNSSFVLNQLKKLEKLAEEFNILVEQSGRSRNTCCRVLCYFLCCCNCACCRCSRFFRTSTSKASRMLFGDLDQSRIIMEKNFKGKQFMIESVPGRNQPKIDCMFFPATQGDLIELQPDFVRLERDPEYAATKKYLNKSTIIMCNPNALIYQGMVTSASAYWLDFFLRRDANVFVWNYRGYGESQQSMFSPNYDPNQQKVDAERVLQFLINMLNVRGQVGVYGRSIGGIAASYLVQKFPKIVKVFIGDRTMGNFDSIVSNRM
mmetsp:Transcript_18098/g.30899  ORF Transcript_18098/g.30899 Transcript_18098/m.30899 type:complete len:412 (+) Transcript_18098:1124-2359(+)